MNISKHLRKVQKHFMNNANLQEVHLLLRPLTVFPWNTELIAVFTNYLENSKEKIDLSLRTKFGTFIEYLKTRHLRTDYTKFDYSNLLII